MVKNKGFLPSSPKEAKVQRKQIKSIVNSLLDPCIEPDLDSGVPFRAQAIIANPPAYGTLASYINGGVDHCLVINVLNARFFTFSL